MSLLKSLFSKNQKTKIEFCQKNLDRFYSEKDLEQFSVFLSNKKVENKEYDCQSYCKECKSSPYAIVNGKFISADSPMELIQFIKNQDQRDGANK
jgi:uncharacterized protein YuzB (UPF0349 family)